MGLWGSFDVDAAEVFLEALDEVFVPVDLGGPAASVGVLAQGLDVGELSLQCVCELLAGEVGHVYAPVVEERTLTTGLSGEELVQRTCRCGRVGCVEAYATPDAIREMTGKSTNMSLRTMAESSASEESARSAFAAGGAALGLGIASMLNWLNPGLVTIYVPPPFKEAGETQAGSAYLAEMERVIRERAFSTAGSTQLDIRGITLPEFDVLNSSAAASLVLERTIEDLEVA